MYKKCCEWTDLDSLSEAVWYPPVLLSLVDTVLTTGDTGETSPAGRTRGLGAPPTLGGVHTEMEDEAQNIQFTLTPRRHPQYNLHHTISSSHTVHSVYIIRAYTV